MGLPDGESSTRPRTGRDARRAALAAALGFKTSANGALCANGGIIPSVRRSSELARASSTPSAAGLFELFPPALRHTRTAGF
jgi:hypothetical protein